VVFNYRAPKIVVPTRGCFCTECIKTSDRPIADDEYHRLIGMGVRPCFSLSGRKLLARAYPLMTARSMDMRSRLAEMNRLEIDRFSRYLPFCNTPRVRSAWYLEARKVKIKTSQPGLFVTELQLWGALSLDRTSEKHRLGPDSLPFVFFEKAWCLLLQQFAWISVVAFGDAYRAEHVACDPPVPNADVLKTFDDAPLALPKPVFEFDVPLRIQIPRNVLFSSPHFIHYGGSPPTRIIVNDRICTVRCEGSYLTMSEYASARHLGPSFMLLSHNVRVPKMFGGVSILRVVKVEREAAVSPLSRSLYLLPSGTW